jgi:hypothetical protein
LAEASELIGELPKRSVRNLERALTVFCATVDSPEDERRLEAARMVLTNWARHRRLVEQRL